MTVYEEFLRSTEQHGDRPFLHIPRQAAAGHGAAIDFTYEQTLDEVMQLQQHYLNAGYGPGQRIALLLGNCAEFFLHFLALNGIGAGIVPVNSGFRAAEMAYVIRHSDALLVVSLPEHAATVMAAQEGEAGSVPVATTSSMTNLPASPRPPESSMPDDLSEAALLYTSGTTGQPKGCMLSNEYFLCIGNWYANLGGYCVLEEGQERMLTPLPLTHMNALAASTMGMMMSGGCIVQLDRFHASTWWETVQESKATCLHYLGVMPAILLNLPESPLDDCRGRIKFGFGAGSDPRHQERFEQRFGFPLIEGWAMTETGTGVCLAANREPRHLGKRCIGRPTGAIEYRLVDEQGADVAPGEPGELLIRAKGGNPRRGFFSGYYKDPDATKAAWEGGYFHTGDVVRVDEEGSFYFVDRRKNIVRRSGENIAAVEVEGVLYQHSAVAACAVVPVPDEIRGEEVAALIVTKEGQTPGPELAADIFRFCLEKLIYFKCPGFVLFADALPMTASQKIQRGELKNIAQQMVEQGRCVDLRERKIKRAADTAT